MTEQQHAHAELAILQVYVYSSANTEWGPANQKRLDVAEAPQLVKAERCSCSC